ncbi:uncharacterized protein LOC143817713 [Ranitomeya variabilis]|uniref:uncharacterized protein LOC143817713 n=1 Tax=Ranitomeya variabilis TaxID=490064 RepID=UPI004056D1A4
MIIKNTIRVVVEDGAKNNVVYVVRDLLEGKAGAHRTDIFSVNEFHNQGIYDVTFVSEPCCLTVFEWLRSHDGDPCLGGVRVEPLFGLMEKIVTVTVYNPYTEVRLLEQFLARYCEYVKSGEKQRNCLGIFNCKYVFRVKLRKDPSCLGGFTHPPANFSVAGHRGFLSYAGQPLYCRKCFQFGHLQNTCEKGMVCRNCKQEGHAAAQCPMPRECDQCGNTGHLYKDCPYGVPRRPTREEERREEEEKKRKEERRQEEKKREEEVKKREERKREESEASAQQSAEVIPPSMVERRRDRRQEDKEAERRKEELEDKLFWRAAKQEERAMVKNKKKKKEAPVTKDEELGGLMDFDTSGAEEMAASLILDSDPESIGVFSSEEEPGGRKCPREGGGEICDEGGGPQRKAGQKKARVEECMEVSGSESCSAQMVEENSGGAV